MQAAAHCVIWNVIWGHFVQELLNVFSDLKCCQNYTSCQDKLHFVCHLVSFQTPASYPYAHFLDSIPYLQKHIYNIYSMNLFIHTYKNILFMRHCTWWNRVDIVLQLISLTNPISTAFLWHMVLKLVFVKCKLYFTLLKGGGDQAYFSFFNWFFSKFLSPKNVISIVKST